MSESEVKVYKLRKDFLLERGFTASDLMSYADISEITAEKFFNGYRTPSIDLLVNLAWDTGTNISYLVGLTEMNMPLDRKDIRLRLRELRWRMGYSARQLSLESGIAYNTVRISELNADYKNAEKSLKFGTLIKFKDFLGVSIDCLLGLSDYMTWEDQDKISTLVNIKPGTAFYLESETYCGDCLMDYDGCNIIFPDGRMVSIEDEDLRLAKVTAYR